MDVADDESTGERWTRHVERREEREETEERKRAKLEETKKRQMKRYMELAKKQREGSEEEEFGDFEMELADMIVEVEDQSTPIFQWDQEEVRLLGNNVNAGKNKRPMRLASHDKPKRPEMVVNDYNPYPINPQPKKNIWDVYWDRHTHRLHDEEIKRYFQTIEWNEVYGQTEAKLAGVANAKVVHAFAQIGYFLTYHDLTRFPPTMMNDDRRFIPTSFLLHEANMIREMLISNSRDLRHDLLPFGNMQTWYNDDFELTENTQYVEGLHYPVIRDGDKYIAVLHGVPITPRTTGLENGLVRFESHAEAMTAAIDIYLHFLSWVDNGGPERTSAFINRTGPNYW